MFRTGELLLPASRFRLATTTTTIPKTLQRSASSISNPIRNSFASINHRKLLPVLRSSPNRTFSSSTIHPVNVSQHTRMEAKQSNEQFKLENLFSVKGKGMSSSLNINLFPKNTLLMIGRQLLLSPAADPASVSWRLKP